MGSSSLHVERNGHSRGQKAKEIFLYKLIYLKYYDNVDTVYATTDLRLNRLEEIANRRDEVIEELKSGYVNPANKNQPVMFCIN